jgi:hypothetical protein
MAGNVDGCGSFWSDLIAIVLRLFLRGVQFFATSRVVSTSPPDASTRTPNLDHILVTENGFWRRFCGAWRSLHGGS